MRPSRALLVGLRPPTPQSPERLRSTPFDCVAIAPCCFAERKAVLSHALAALTALGPVRGQSRRDMLRGADRAYSRARSKPWRYASRRSPRLDPCAVKAAEICARGAAGNLFIEAETIFSREHATLQEPSGCAEHESGAFWQHNLPESNLNLRAQFEFDTSICFSIHRDPETSKT